MAATGYRPPQHWPQGRCLTELATHPVVWVTWHDAAAYARWAGKALPSSRQWEKAADGQEWCYWPRDYGRWALTCYLVGDILPLQAVWAVCPASSGTAGAGARRCRQGDCTVVPRLPQGRDVAHRRASHRVLVTNAMRSSSRVAPACLVRTFVCSSEKQLSIAVARQAEARASRAQARARDGTGRGRTWSAFSPAGLPRPRSPRSATYPDSRTLPRAGPSPKRSGPPADA